MNRSNVALSVLLVIQLALVGLALRPSTTAPPKEKNFLDGIGKEAVTALEIRDENTTLRLEKQDNGWIVKADHDYPADSGKIDKLVAKLVGLASNRLVARTPASHVRLKVADEVFNRKLTVTAGEQSQTLFFGSSPSYKTLHVRLAGEEEVYLVKDLSVWELQTTKESWWTTRYLDVNTADLARLELENRAGKLVLERDKDAESPWRLASAPDKTLDPQAVEDLLNAACRLNLLSYLGTEDSDTYGLDKPAITLRLATKEGRSVTVRIGPKRKDENDHVAKREDSPFYVSVAAYAVEKLLDKKAENLVAAAPKNNDKGGEAPPPADSASQPASAQPATGDKTGASQGAGE